MVFFTYVINLSYICYQMFFTYMFLSLFNFIRLRQHKKKESEWT